MRSGEVKSCPAQGIWKSLSFGVSGAIRGALLDFRPDVVVGVDAPDFNLAADEGDAPGFDGDVRESPFVLLTRIVGQEPSLQSPW